MSAEEHAPARADDNTENLLEGALGLAYEGKLCRIQFRRSGVGIRLQCPHHRNWRPLLEGSQELAHLLAAVIKHCDQMS